VACRLDATPRAHRLGGTNAARCDALRCIAQRGAVGQDWQYAERKVLGGGEPLAADRFGALDKMAR